MRPILGVIIGIMNGNDIVLLQRRVYPYVGLWNLPGGKIELGEHVQETAIREAKEETGLDVEFVAIRGIISEVVQRKDGKDHYFNFVCEVRSKDRELEESDEGNLKWVKLEKADEEELSPSEWAIIKEFLIDKKTINVYKIHVKKNGKQYELESFGV